ncbi:MAG: zinc ribbon domain-containing protein [Thermoplasmata archaeon]|nr:MAG: zinc ribbon domain-containing protein [Thermoplasmata archaeon]
MTQETERYLSRVKLWMFSMPRKTRKGIIQELRSHIVESAQAAGGPEMESTVIAEMDSPRKAAKMYKQIYGYGLPFRILFIFIVIFLSILTVPVWELRFPDFSTGFMFLLLILVLFYIGSKAGKKMALGVGITAMLTRFIFLGLIASGLGEQGIIQGGGGFLFFLSSVLLIPISYLPARALQKWEEKGSYDIPPSNYNETRKCPRCEASISTTSKFCSECGGRVW